MRGTIVMALMASAPAFAPGLCPTVRAPAVAHMTMRTRVAVDGNKLEVRRANKEALAPKKMRPSGVAHTAALRETSLAPQLFQLYDTHGKDSIDAFELKALLMNGMKDADPHAMELATGVLLQRADFDGNGVLDYDEFQRLITVLVSTMNFDESSAYIARAAPAVPDMKVRREEK